MPEPLKGSPGAAGTGAAKEELRATAAHGLAVDVEYDIQIKIQYIYILYNMCKVYVYTHVYLYVGLDR